MSMCFPEQQNSLVRRAPWCNADNCYRGLFPCPSPSAVAEAVRFCVTVSADSATNYPTRAINACGTSKDRYISACSCPATNCPVGESVTKTTTSQQTTQHTVPLEITTTTAEKVSSVYEPVGKMTLDQVPETEPKGAALTQTVNNVADGSGAESSARSTDRSITMEITVTEDALSHHSSSSTTHGKATSEEKPLAESQLPTPSSYSLLSHPTIESLDQSLNSSSSLLLPVLSETGSSTRSKTSHETSRPTQTILSVPTSTNTPDTGPEGLGAGLVAAIAVGGTLVVLLLIGAAGYCCLKRRTARRARASSLIGKGGPIEEVNASSEWKPPVELPHQTVKASLAELQSSLVLHPEPSDSVIQSLPTTPSILSACSPLAAQDAVEMQGDSACVSPAELFVMPAELPGGYQI